MYQYLELQILFFKEIQMISLYVGSSVGMLETCILWIVEQFCYLVIQSGGHGICCALILRYGIYSCNLPEQNNLMNLLPMYFFLHLH
jgi:hypothetical protein